MTHDLPLITTMAAGLACAFALGLLAHRLRLPLIAGYLMAGIIIGPFTPGFVADQDIASQLAEMGVILLMFGVGLHFSVKELMAVWKIAVPGAIGQIAVATGSGFLLAWSLGWGIGAGLIFGLCLSVASTVVLLRALQDNGLLQTDAGKIAVGWLIVEDLIMVFSLVLIPPLAGLLGGAETGASNANTHPGVLGMGAIASTLVITAAKISLFVGIMLVVGSRLIPLILHHTAHTGQRELFRLAVLAIALGVAFVSSSVFGVSFALGAFFAGMVMAGSTLSAQAMRDVLPLRDAFAVLFFVSVGMLFDPSVLWLAPVPLVATVTIIIAVKSVAAFGIVRVFGLRRYDSLTIAASLAQVGEFSFILVVMATDLEIVSSDVRDLVVAGALFSILLNPLLFNRLVRLKPST